MFFYRPASNVLSFWVHTWRYWLLIFAPTLPSSKCHISSTVWIIGMYLFTYTHIQPCTFMPYLKLITVLIIKARQRAIYLLDFCHWCYGSANSKKWSRSHTAPHWLSSKNFGQLLRRNLYPSGKTWNSFRRMHFVIYSVIYSSPIPDNLCFMKSIRGSY